MWTSFCTWLATKILPKVGWLLTIIIARVGQTVAADFKNELYNRKAYELVKKLANDKSLSGKQKAEVFNREFRAWLSASGKAISESVLNLFRELAINALKLENKTEE